MTNTTEGIVIKEMRYKETSKILTILTKEYGKISVLAKGAYKAKSKLIASTQMFALSEYQLYKGKTFFYINEADIVTPFYEIRESIDRMMIGSYMLELIDLGIMDELPSEKMFNFFKKGLMVLSTLESDFLKFIVAYELKFISFLGYRPILGKCITCGDKSKQEILFSVEDGGVICSKCGNKFTKYHYIDKDILYAMTKLIMTELDKLDEIVISSKILFTVHNIMVKYILDKLDRKKFNSLSMYGKMNTKEGSDGY